MFKKNPSNSLIPSFFMSDLSKSLRSLTNNEQFEQIAQVAHQKWVNMIDSLRSLTKNERPLELNLMGYCKQKISYQEEAECSHSQSDASESSVLFSLQKGGKIQKK